MDLIMQVAKWGNSLAVRLPKKVVEELGLKPGDEIAFLPLGEKRYELTKDDRRERALAAIRARQWTLPEGYRFDRDEANER
jgi:antitoxin MazE